MRGGMTKPNILATEFHGENKGWKTVKETIECGVVNLTKLYSEKQGVYNNKALASNMLWQLSFFGDEVVSFVGRQQNDIECDMLVCCLMEKGRI